MYPIQVKVVRPLIKKGGYHIYLQCRFKSQYACDNENWIIWTKGNDKLIDGKTLSNDATDFKDQFFFVVKDSNIHSCKETRIKAEKEKEDKKAEKEKKRKLAVKEKQSAKRKIAIEKQEKKLAELKHEAKLENKMGIIEQYAANAANARLPEKAEVKSKLEDGIGRKRRRLCTAIQVVTESKKLECPDCFLVLNDLPNFFRHLQTDHTSVECNSNRIIVDEAAIRPKKTANSTKENREPPRLNPLRKSNGGLTNLGNTCFMNAVLQVIRT